ncbi:5'/3'-nucleotidase SurE [Taibaiella helva]|uniref:5'/3'-nucleotidase SurE n=1 Tax=Taibaiella helva TaxID=2301235 RepID=UPI000E5881F6|nr:5'/3'-nucleotidase SurE [Taibaiella helva]
MDLHTRPVILITNDDGITAPGIRSLIEAVHDLGEVIVVAPDSPQSGMGHAITIGKPLRLDEVNVFQDLGIKAYQSSGTPVDCVKLAHDVILHHRPDICLSGINHGSNASINVIYSGTMSAAMEAAVEGIPSAGFSLLDFNFDADFSIAKMVAREVAQRMLAEPMPEHFLLNVNIPKVKQTGFKGIRVCRQADAKWAENFDKRKDPRGRDYYWMTGKFINRDRGADTDIEALNNGYASIVPVRIDFTDNRIKQWMETKYPDFAQFQSSGMPETGEE